MKHRVPPFPNPLAWLLASFLLLFLAIPLSLKALEFRLTYDLQYGGWCVTECYDKNPGYVYDIKIPDTGYDGLPVTSIGPKAFESFWFLRSLSIPNTVRAIGADAFRGCDEIKNLVLPDSLRVIGESAFRSFRGLSSLILPDSLRIIGAGAFAGCDNLTLVDFPDSLQSIGNSAFAGCGFTNFVMPVVAELGCGILLGCTKLKSLAISKDVRLGYLFEERQSGGNVTQYFEDGTTKMYSIPTTLEELTILEGCGMIPYGGLSNCNMLKKLTLPSSLYMIGEKGLYGCAQLSDIYCQGAAPAAAYDNSFDGMRLTSCKLHVPHNSGDLYKEAEGWKRFRYIQEEAPIEIKVTKNIENAGVVFGLDEYQPGQTAELRAVANSGYTFEGWYDGGTLLTSEATYSFSVIGSRDLVALFLPVVNSNPVEVNAPGETATLSWPAVDGAVTYEVVAYSDEAMTHQVATVTLDASGNVVGSRAGVGVSVTLTGLTKETGYYYSVNAKGVNGVLLSRYDGSFTTGTAGIWDVAADSIAVSVVGYYNAQGARSTTPWRGLNIVVYSDGTTRKLINN